MSLKKRSFSRLAPLQAPRLFIGLEILIQPPSSSFEWLIPCWTYFCCCCCCHLSRMSDGEIFNCDQFSKSPPFFPFAAIFSRCAQTRLTILCYESISHLPGRLLTFRSKFSPNIWPRNVSWVHQGLVSGGVCLYLSHPPGFVSLFINSSFAWRSTFHIWKLAFNFNPIWGGGLET